MQQPKPLRLNFAGEDIDAGDVAAGAVEAGDEAEPNRIVAAREYDRNPQCFRRLHRPDGRRTGRKNDCHLPMNQIGAQRRQAIAVSLRPAILDRHIAPFGEAAFAKTVAEFSDKLDRFTARRVVEEADHRHRRLLRTRRERPQPPRRRAA